MKPKFQLKSVPMLIAIIMALLPSELFAQEKIDYTQLRGKEWVMQLPTGMEGFMSQTFTTDACIIVAKHSGKSIELNSIYYLSDDWNGTFDDAKVGVWITGKYLIKKRKTKVRKVILINVYEILKLTETELELRNVEDLELSAKGELLRRDKTNSIILYKIKQE